MILLDTWLVSVADLTQKTVVRCITMYIAWADIASRERGEITKKFRKTEEKKQRLAENLKPSIRLRPSQKSVEGDRGRSF